MLGAHDLLTRWPALEVTSKRARLRETLHLTPGPLVDALEAHALNAARAAAGLWQRDARTWSADPAVQQRIANRLGWLDSPLLMAEARDRLRDFAASVKRDGYTDVVLLGMGGSSLAPEVLRAVLGVTPGWLRLHVLDSVDPDAIRAAMTPPGRTLYLLASKSGTTIEPNCLAAYFRRQLEDAGIPRWADHFTAITDEGTSLADLARGEGFRELFINPSDIGGRYSALSYFGLVPAALMGQDIEALVGWAVAMLSASDPATTATASNPATALGLAMGAAARSGRDKLTLILPDALDPFGLWVEQLIAESTGKHGTGIVPIVGERLGEPDAYGADRFFVQLRLSDPGNQPACEALVGRLEATNAPIMEIELPDAYALGAEFIRWETATAVAGALLGVNPFDEPNVQQAKDATRLLLDRYKSLGRLTPEPPDLTTEDGVTLTLGATARRELAWRPAEAFLALIGQGDYLGLLAYVGPDRELAGEFAAFRQAVRDRTRAATMFGYGPRYLHSTGQLHKGGPNTGVFLLFSAEPRADLAVPGEAFSFGTLELAQALGDFASLDAAGRRALHVHLPAPDHRLVRRVAEGLLERLP